PGAPPPLGIARQGMSPSGSIAVSASPPAVPAPGHEAAVDVLQHSPNQEPDPSNQFSGAVDKMLDASILPAQNPAGAAGPKIQLDPKRFEEPVHKIPEVKNKFGEAVEKALDAMIMPQAKEDAK